MLWDENDDGYFVLYKVMSCWSQIWPPGDIVSALLRLGMVEIEIIHVLIIPYQMVLTTTVFNEKSANILPKKQIQKRISSREKFVLVFYTKIKLSNVKAITWLMLFPIQIQKEGSFPSPQNLPWSRSQRVSPPLWTTMNLIIPPKDLLKKPPATQRRRWVLNLKSQH